MSDLGPALPTLHPSEPGAPHVNAKALMKKIGGITVGLIMLVQFVAAATDEYLSAPLTEQSIARSMGKAQDPQATLKGDCFNIVPDVRTEFKFTFKPRPWESFIVGKITRIFDQPETIVAGNISSYKPIACNARKKQLTHDQVVAARDIAYQAVIKNILESDLYTKNAGRKGVATMAASLELK